MYMYNCSKGKKYMKIYRYMDTKKLTLPQSQRTQFLAFWTEMREGGEI